MIALFLIARLLLAQSWNGATGTAPPPVPYQRGQFRIRRFRAQAEALCAALSALIKPAPAPGFVHRALTMLESTGWVAAHRFLFAGVRCHLLGWRKLRTLERKEVARLERCDRCPFRRYGPSTK